MLVGSIRARGGYIEYSIKNGSSRQKLGEIKLYLVGDQLSARRPADLSQWFEDFYLLKL